jgi:hypothetical protein
MFKVLQFRVFSNVENLRKFWKDRNFRIFANFEF